MGSLFQTGCDTAQTPRCQKLFADCVCVVVAQALAEMLMDVFDGDEKTLGRVEGLLIRDEASGIGSL